MTNHTICKIILFNLAETLVPVEKPLSKYYSLIPRGGAETQRPQRKKKRKKRGVSALFLNTPLPNSLPFSAASAPPEFGGKVLFTVFCIC